MYLAHLPQMVRCEVCFEAYWAFSTWHTAIGFFSPIHITICMRGSCASFPPPPLCESPEAARGEISLCSIRGAVLANQTSVNG